MTSGSRPRGAYGDVYPSDDQGMLGRAFSGNDQSCSRSPKCGSCKFATVRFVIHISSQAHPNIEPCLHTFTAYGVQKARSQPEITFTNL